MQVPLHLTVIHIYFNTACASNTTQLDGGLCTALDLFGLPLQVIAVSKHLPF